MSIAGGKWVTVRRNDLLSLWQEVEKHHIEGIIDMRIEARDWDDFVNEVETEFHEITLVFALKLWQKWADENGED